MYRKSWPNKFPFSPCNYSFPEFKSNWLIPPSKLDYFSSLLIFSYTSTSYKKDVMKMLFECDI